MGGFSPIDRIYDDCEKRKWEKIDDHSSLFLANHPLKNRALSFFKSKDSSSSNSLSTKLKGFGYSINHNSDFKNISTYIDNYGRDVFFNRFEVVIGFFYASAIEVSKLCNDYGLKKIWFDWNGLYGLFSGQLNIEQLLVKMSNDPRVKFAEPNVLNGFEEYYDSDLEDDGIDPPKNKLWNHEVVGRYKRWSELDGQGVIVAVVDTLIDIDHPCLTSKFYPKSHEYNFSGNNMVTMSHGTSVASIISATSMSENGFPLGLAPGSKILPVCIDTSSSASYAKRAIAINFLAKAFQQKKIISQEYGELPIPRMVVNCSWQLQNSQDLTCMKLAFEALTSSGAICVCSAGNDDSNGPHFPSDYPGCISVAGLTRSLHKSPSSNYGKRVNISLPGGDGTPFDEDDIIAASKGSSFNYVSGTSFAAPHCAAILASLWSRNNELTGQAIIDMALNDYTIATNEINPEISNGLGRGILILNK
ncbi:S8 family peptidase [Enterobacteriaceae bacterium C23F]